MTRTKNDGQAALSFLEKNRLDPTPDNYRIAYLYVMGTDPSVMRKIDDIVDNGMRLKQEEADQLTERLSGSVRSERTNNAQRHQDRETDRIVASIVEAAVATTRTTRDFGRDVANEGRVLRANPTAEQLAIGLRRILDRTEQAERELGAASQDIAKLRTELDQTRQRADTDELTGLCNRRAIRRILNGLDAEEADYSIAMIDIDHFKSINDDYGHEIGDRALRHVARCISDSLPGCQVARWGGEEFLVVSRDPAVDSFAELVERARLAVAEKKLELRANDRPMRVITFSAGISSKSENADSTIRLADLRAYAAKRAGRNTIVVDAG